VDAKEEHGSHQHSDEEPSDSVLIFSDRQYLFVVHMCGGKVFKRHTSVDTVVGGNCRVEGFLAPVVRVAGFLNLPADKVVKGGEEVLADPLAVVLGNVFDDAGFD
jgi:hypothetical protein